jgi:hypothetical protein
MIERDTVIKGPVLLILREPANIMEQGDCLREPRLLFVQTQVHRDPYGVQTDLVRVFTLYFDVPLVDFSRQGK